MKLQGTVETDLRFALARIHFGEKDGRDFSQLSFPNLGDMNNDAGETTITESTVDLIFDLNHMPCLIRLEMADGKWSGTVKLETILLDRNLEVRKISDAPNFREHHFIIPEENVRKLKEHRDYDNETCEGILQYELNDPNVLAYIKEKGIDVENHHDFATACALMKKTCEIIHHDGVNYCHDRKNRGTIAQIKFAEKQNNMTNCRGIAIILAGVLRAYGFRANIVECRPEKSDNADIHVVCEVFLEEYGKAIMLDPSSNMLYFLNGQPLSLMELREAVCDGQAENITTNEDASHNGEEISKIQMLAYMSKNFIILRKCIRSDEGSEMGEDNAICLVSRELLEDRFPESTYFTCNIQKFYAAK